ncbi:MAG: Stealth CR1 domain-containing protein [Pseudohongiellaceae bacterium]
MPDSIDHGIDAVVTWVNGEDPVHRARLNVYLESIGHRPKVADAQRYRETGEFAYCIASLLTFAPWLRKIHIIADAQEPDFMASIRQSPWRDKVVMVDHTVLFKGYEQYLPTFNIRSIKSMFWNIPDLAEQFVFLNDDFMVMRPIQPSHWFNKGKAVLSGRWMLQHPGVVLSQLLGNRRLSSDKRPGNHQAQAYSARLAEFRYRYLKVPHKPHPLLRSVMEAYMAAHPDQLAHNISFPLRDGSQFLADSLVNHLALKQGKAEVSNRFATLRFKPTDYRQPRLNKLLKRIETDPTILYACFQSLESMDDSTRQAFFSWLDQHIGNPSALFASGAGGKLL